MRLADHWRRDLDGHRLLSLRRIRVFVLHLPADAALVRKADPNPSWSIGDVLLAHVWQAVAGSKSPHPMLAAEARRVRTPSNTTADRRRAIAAARRHAAARRRAIELGEIT